MNPVSTNSRSLAVPFADIAAHIGGEHLAVLNAVKEMAAQQGAAVYLVGGPVRDWLLGVPVRDLDFVVAGDAPALARSLAAATGGQAVIHSRFGTATLRLSHGRFDLVTARREEYPVPGALPKVQLAGLPEDLTRRDFSINAMALPLSSGATDLYDPHGGREDLRNGLIRTLHPQSFRDDPTRLFRAVRYEQRLGFRLEQETEMQLRAAAAGDYCSTVTGDRLRQELVRIFEEECPGNILRRAVELGILASLTPALTRRDFLTRWAAVGSRIDAAGETGGLGWLAALAYPLSEPEGVALVSRLNMPVGWAQVVQDTIEVRSTETWLGQSGRTPSRVSRLLDGKRPEALYVVAGLTDSPVVAANLLRYLGEFRQVRPALRGRDLVELGIPAGPRIGKVLSELRDARLDGRVGSWEEECRWVETLISGGPEQFAAAQIDPGRGSI